MTSDQEKLASLKGRAIPHNIDAEKSILAAMSLTLDACATAVAKLLPEDFYKEEHRHLFQILLDLYDENQPGDVVSVVEALKKKSLLESCGGVSGVSSVLSSAATAAHLEHHIEIIREKRTLRELIQTATSIVTDSYRPDTEIKELLDQAEKKIFEIAQAKVERDFVHIKTLIRSSIEKAEQLYNMSDELTGLPTGLTKLDEMTNGLQPSDMIVLAARPSMGKTALALNIVEHAAVAHKKSVGFFSLEMSKEQVVFRILCSNAYVGGQALRSGFASKEDFSKLATAASRLAAAPIFIDDTPGITVMEMKGKARRLKAKSDVQLLVIDYLQLMSGSGGRSDGRQQEISDISRSVKELARELNIPIIILSQLNRAVENRTDHRPMLSDLRESGAIEQDADVVMMLMRKEYYNSEVEPGLADLIVAKQRNGPVGDIKLHFNKDCTRFENLSFGDQDLMDMKDPADVFE